MINLGQITSHNQAYQLIKSYNQKYNYPNQFILKLRKSSIVHYFLPIKIQYTSNIYARMIQSFRRNPQLFPNSFEENLKQYKAVGTYNQLDQTIKQRLEEEKQDHQEERENLLKIYKTFFSYPYTSKLDGFILHKISTDYQDFKSQIQEENNNLKKGIELQLKQAQDYFIKLPEQVQQQIILEHQVLNEKVIEKRTQFISLFKVPKQFPFQYNSFADFKRINNKSKLSPQLFDQHKQEYVDKISIWKNIYELTESQIINDYFQALHYHREREKKYVNYSKKKIENLSYQEITEMTNEPLIDEETEEPPSDEDLAEFKSPVVSQSKTQRKSKKSNNIQKGREEL